MPILRCQNLLKDGGIDGSENSDEIEMLTRTEILMPTFQSQSLRESARQISSEEPQTPSCFPFPMTGTHSSTERHSPFRSLHPPISPSVCTEFCRRVKGTDTLPGTLIDVKNGIRSVTVYGVEGVGKALIQWFCEATHHLALAAVSD